MTLQSLYAGQKSGIWVGVKLKGIPKTTMRDEEPTMNSCFSRLLTRTCIFVIVLSVALLCLGQSVALRAGSPRIYIEPQNGFESYISAAIVKKHVPAVVAQNKDEATFILTSAVVSKEESGGSKVARCLFLYCAGIQGTQTATVQLTNSRTQEVARAYNVRKASATAYQSTSEAIAKHLKEFLEKHPE